MKAQKGLCFEVITRSAERYARIDGLHAGQREIKPQRVFSGKKACEQIMTRVVIVQFRLKTEHFFRRMLKDKVCFLQLERIGNILCIINDHIGAPCV